MRHTPASGATVFMLRSLKMHRMAQAVGEPNRESNRNIHEKAGFGERSMNAVIVIPARSIRPIARQTDEWGLPRDYPMVAPNYAATRSALAKASGLG